MMPARMRGTEAGVEDALQMLNKYGGDSTKLLDWASDIQAGGSRADYWVYLGANKYKCVRTIGYPVRARYDVYVDNNYGKLSLGADLRLFGTPAAPAVEGQVVVQPGSELKLAGTEYEVQRAVLSFDGQPSLRPEVQLLITTRISISPCPVAAAAPLTLSA